MKNVVIYSTLGTHVAVSEETWNDILNVQKGTDKLNRDVYQFVGRLPGLVDEDGSIVNVRCAASKDGITVRGVQDFWRKSNLKVRKAFISP